MSTRPTALAIARAMLTTPVSRFGMLERMPLCTRFSDEANRELVDLMLGKGLSSHWTVERLADELEDEATFHITTATPEPVLERLREEGGLTWQQARRFRDAHLPQGAPTSAALANLCAFRLDTRIAGLARAFGARYTRYADDIVLSGDAGLRRAADRIEARIGGFALDEGFALNHRKTRCVPAARRQEVAHIVVNGKPNLPRAEFDRLKATLHRCATQGPSSQNREGLPQWEQHLRGRVAWAAQVNADKAQRLQRLLARIDWTA